MINDRKFIRTEKNSGKIVKRIFWQTSINEQRPKLKVQVNGVSIAGLLETEADCSIISPESWHPSWPLQDINVQFWSIGSISISQVK